MSDATVQSVKSAGHPLRRTMKTARRAGGHREEDELKLFVLSFTAFFICIYSFIF